MTALGILSLRETLKQFVDYCERGCPRVSRITLDCSFFEAKAAGVKGRNGCLTYRGREVVLVPRGKL